MNSERRSGSGLTVTARAVSDGVVLAVSGALDYTSVDRFGEAVAGAFESGATILTADLGGLVYCDSSGVAALVRAHKLALREGRHFVVRAPNTTLSRVFALTGLDAILTVEN